VILEELILHALEAVGYHGLEPTVENLIQCFHDFVDAGIWHDLNLQDGHVYFSNGDELTDVKSIMKELLRISGR
jgi:hypothetical protein